MKLIIKVHETQAYTEDNRWCATFDSYDGAPDSGNRHRMGFGSSKADAIHDLVMNYIEEELAAQGSGMPSTTQEARDPLNP